MHYWKIFLTNVSNILEFIITLIGIKKEHCISSALFFNDV
jgi:hypothetical protein